MKYTYYLSHKKTQAEITTVKQVNNKCEKKLYLGTVLFTVVKCKISPQNMKKYFFSGYTNA